MTTHTKLFTFALLLLSSLTAAERAGAQTLISGWNFNNDTGGASGTVTPNPAASTGAGTASTLGMANSYGTPGTSTDGSDVFTTTSTSDQGASDPTTQASNNIWRIRGASPNNGWSSAAPIGSQGAQFLASTATFQNIQVQFDWYCTTQGEAKLQVQYTTDGTHYFNVPAADFSALSYGSVQKGVANSPTTVVSQSSSSNTVDGTYLLAPAQGWTDLITINLSAITAANNDPNFGIQLVNASTGADDVSAAGTALNNSSGNWRFDEVNISSTPEPSTFAAIALGLGGLGLFLRLRRRKVA